MTIIDTRYRDASPDPFRRAVVSKGKVISSGGKVTVPPIDPARRRASNPLTWTKYSKDVNVSIAGLGSTRQFKRHPGKHFPMVNAIWRESAAEADRAAQQARRAFNKTKTGAAKSL